MLIPKKIEKLKVAAMWWALFVLPGSAAALASETIPLEVDRERSRIAAHVQATGHSFDAVVTDYELDLKMDAASREIVFAVLTFDFADVETGRERRDREMREWLDYDSHPVAEFVLQEVDTTNDEVLVRGTLTMHGEENEIEFPVAIEEFEDGIRVTGHTVIDHRDWGLERIRAFVLMIVDPNLRIEFDLFAAPPENR